MTPDDALLTYVLRLGDNALLTGQRMIERVTGEPELEEELANANFALDYIGQARLYYSYAGELDANGRKALEAAFIISNNRTPEADLDFSILLLVEIAQRALSPGLNDGFTAIAVIDHLSGAFSKILTRPEPSSLYRDGEGRARVWCELVSVERLLGTAFHPLRRDGMSNLTVILRLLAAIGRLAIVARPMYRDFLIHHVDLIAQDGEAYDFNEDDRAELARACDRVRKALGRED